MYKTNIDLAKICLKFIYIQYILTYLLSKGKTLRWKGRKKPNTFVK